MLIALATFLKYELYTTNVTAAFLSAEIDSVVYVRPPAGLEEEDNKVWLLKRSLYGLHQSPRLWYKKMTDTLMLFGFSPDPNESHLWAYQDSIGVIFLALYVDDALVAVSSAAMAER